MGLNLLSLVSISDSFSDFSSEFTLLRQCYKYACVILYVMLFKIIVVSRENTTLKCCCSKYSRILERVNEWLIVEEIII